VLTQLDTAANVVAGAVIVSVPLAMRAISLSLRHVLNRSSTRANHENARSITPADVVPDV